MVSTFRDTNYCHILSIGVVLEKEASPKCPKALIMQNYAYYTGDEYSNQNRHEGFMKTYASFENQKGKNRKIMIEGGNGHRSDSRDSRNKI